MPALDELPDGEADKLLAVAENAETKLRRASAEDASKLARQLMGCYRGRDFIDAETFAAALAMTLSAHPIEVARLVCDPLVGIPSRLKFPPSLAEVREEIEVETAKLKRVGRMVERARQWAPPEPPKAVPEQCAETLAKLQALSATLGANLTMSERLKRERQALKAKIPAATDGEAA